MLVSSGSICSVCSEGKSSYNAVVLPCGHVACARCVVDSDREGWIGCNLCQEAFNRSASPPCARPVFDEPTENPQLQTRIESLELSLDEEKRARKDFESDLLRQLLKMSLKEEEKDHQEVETLRAEMNIMKSAISVYLQELDGVRNKFAAMERRYASLENEMKVTKARGDKEISRLQEALMQEKQRTGTRNSDRVAAGATSGAVETEESSPTIDATRTALRGSRPPAVKTEEPQAVAKPVVRGIAVESRQAVVPDGRRGRVFKPVVPTKGTQFDTDTTDMDTDSNAEAVADAKPSPERSDPLLARKTPGVSLRAKVLPDKATGVSAPPAVEKQRVLKRGAEIKWKGYGCPQNTAVPECTVASGIHNFKGSGTNQYMRKYTCRGCGFSCSEPW